MLSDRDILRYLYLGDKGFLLNYSVIVDLEGYL